ncbi:ATP-binding cassette domain-containing protein [Aquimarina hainanensis]|uniref:ATP-binding cassette domain-containing protein n=1 Tax=Aquimarina hainanensis TaxID=1578017 RepID=A0ABW5N2G9_9FLAO
MNQALFIGGMHKSFNRVPILENISLWCYSGEIIGLFGRNGSGKSTLLKCIYGVIKKDEGQVLIDGKRMTFQKIIREKKIGYLPQNSFLPKEKSVRDLIPLFFPEEAKQDAIFYAPGVHKLEKTRVGKLSLGALRYLEVLFLMNCDHPFLMLDEPFSMIQPLYKERIKELLLSAKKEKGIIITDHYYEDVLTISDRNILVKDRKLIPINSADDLKIAGYLR